MTGHRAPASQLLNPGSHGRQWRCSRGQVPKDARLSTSTEAVEPRDVWSSYGALVTVGYFTYGLGAAGPHLRSELGLSNSEVGLHSSALAVGLVVVGVVGAALGRRFGERTVRGAAIVLLGLALLLLVTAPSLEATLAAGTLVGLGAGALLGYANATLGASGGKPARLRLARGHVGAMVAASVVPVAMAASASVGPGWWVVGLLPGAVLLGVNALGLRGGRRLTVGSDEVGGSRLPPRFWLAWAYLVAVIGMEFSIVFWGATLVELRADLTLPQATAIGGLFLGGMFMGRVGLGLGLGAGQGTRRSMVAGLALTAVGIMVVWVSTDAVVSAGGLLLAGLGAAVLYPLGTAAAIARAPTQAARAGTRLTLATGLAILVAPFLLGIAADATGVVSAWGLVLGLVVVALALVLRISDEPTTVGPDMDITTPPEMLKGVTEGRACLAPAEPTESLQRANPVASAMRPGHRRPAVLAREGRGGRSRRHPTGRRRPPRWR